MIETLSLDLINTHGGTQSREGIDDDVVADYAKTYEGATGGECPFPPFDVFFDGADYWLADGFHRHHGATYANRSSHPCVIHQGSQRDAILFAVGANADHGLRRSNADKRHAVTMLLDDSEWSQRSARWIAEHARVSRALVQQLIDEQRAHPPEVEVAEQPPDRVDGRDGKSYPRNAVGTCGVDESTDMTSAAPDLEDCPNCGGNEWDEHDEGRDCSNCHHPYGEPAGDADAPAPPDPDDWKTQRTKTLKTAEALLREIADLNDKRPNDELFRLLDARAQSTIEDVRRWQ